MIDPKDEIPATELSSADARILDFLAEHGFDASRVAELPAEDRPRALAIIRQMDVLERYPVDPPHESVVDATLARIDRFEAERTASMRIGGRWRPRVRLADVVGVAALLLVATGVALPMISQVRAQSLSTVCANNLRALGAGLSNYANEHGGSMPAMAGIGGGLFGGDQPAPHAAPTAARTNAQPPAVQAAERAALARAMNAVHGGITVTVVPNWGSFQHSANLALLVSKGYCDVHALRCPGCAAGAACFAYRVPAQGARFQLDTPHRIVVVSDANPVIELRRNGHQIDRSILSSRNHNEAGQNLLFSDASVEWRTSPILNASAPTGIDNIWLPRGEDGRERTDLKVRPKDPTDTFVSQ